MGGQVAVLGVQTNGSLERGRAILADRGVGFRCIKEPNLVARLDVRSVPYTVLVRPDGSMVKGVIGGHSRTWIKEQVLALTAR